MINLEFLKERPLSYSSLSAFKKSPAHYIEYLKGKRSPSAAQAKGSLVDVLILSPDDFEKNYFVMEEQVDRRTKDGKEKYEAMMVQAQGKNIVSKQEYEEASFIRDKVYSNPLAADKLQMLGSTQASIKWEDPTTGLPIIAKLDGLGEEIILELKTAADASPENFERDAFKWNYPLQAGIYSEAIKRKFFKFPQVWYIVVETVAPYGICVRPASDDYVNYGIEQYEKLLTEFKYCMDNNLWEQSYEFKSVLGHHILDIPGWAKYKAKE